jgi:hypothetical protein
VSQHDAFRRIRKPGTALLLHLAKGSMTWEMLAGDIVWLLVLPLAIASVSWTVTHEEVFREPREYCLRRSKTSHSFVVRKAFYVFTCEYCFSHYVAAVWLWLTGYRLMLDGWRGFALALFATNAIANVYMSAFARLRLEVKSERLETEVAEQQIRALKPGRRA